MLICRTERPGDSEEIDELVCAAYGHERTADLVWRLREQGAITISQVAEYEGAIMGHLLMSPALINGEDIGWLILNPISVWPECQHQGIASTMLREALNSANELDWAGVLVQGELAFFARFGFKLASELGFSAPATELPLLALAFKPLSFRVSAEISMPR